MFHIRRFVTHTRQCLAAVCMARTPRRTTFTTDVGQIQ